MGIDGTALTHEGDIAKATHYMRQGLAEALSVRPLPTAASRSYGCMIKYKP